jgi:GAF domain-containing protein/GGDEF domain-containing protein
MGLLERALQYKQRLNSDGRETLIDTIKGPAETDFVLKTDASAIDSTVQDDEHRDEVAAEAGEKKDISSPEDSSESFISENDDSGIDIDSDPDSNSESESFSVDENKTEENTGEENIILSNDADSQFIEESSEDISGDNEAVIDAGIENDDVSAEGEGSDLPPMPEMPYFDDYMVLFEIQKEFYRNESVEEVFGTILFSVMGQLGVSSASILFPDKEDINRFVVADSSGLKISDSNLSWNKNEGILKIIEESREVVDIDQLKDDADLREEYFNFISINTRLLVPMFADEELIGAVCVGEKINGEDFNTTEINFLNSLSQMAANVVSFVEKFEKAESERIAFRIESEILSDVEFFQNSLLDTSNAESLTDNIRKNFYSLGLESYAIFLQQDDGEDYYPAFFEEDDNMGFGDSGFIIRNDNRFISFLVRKNASIIVDNFVDSAVINDTFGSRRLEKMEQFIAYPFVITGKLTGFIAIFKINPAIDLPDIDIRIRKISKFLFPYIDRIFQLDPENNLYRDLTSNVYSRIENEIRKADELGIPLTLLLFSIKNYKRFYDRFGGVETGLLFSRIESIIKGRLSTGDFSAKIDRHKFIAVFPGKDRKFAATFSSVIKNEITAHYGSSDFKLLVSFITAEFPVDGNDLYSLLDVLD